MLEKVKHNESLSSGGIQQKIMGQVKAPNSGPFTATWLKGYKFSITLICTVCLDLFCHLKKQLCTFYAYDPGYFW